MCEAWVGGITTLGVLCVLLKRWTSACQKGSFAIFRGQVIIIDSSGAKCVPFFLEQQQFTPNSLGPP